MATLPKPLPKSKPSPSRTRQTAKLTPATPKHTLPAGKFIPATKAKAHLLELLDNVDRKREPVTITKRGRPVARLVPIDDDPPRGIFGCMKGTFRITGDIVGPEPDIWEAMS